MDISGKKHDYYKRVSMQPVMDISGKKHKHTLQLNFSVSVVECVVIL